MIGSYISPQVDKKSINLLDGYELIKAMYKKYEGKWFAKLYNKQKVTYYKNGEAERDEIWSELISIPGKVRSNIGNIEDGNCEISKNDSQFVFKEGKLAFKRRAVHVILLLGFDVYTQNNEKTFEQLKESNFNIDKLYETNWQNKPVYVVGTLEGDEETNQFWIDKKHLYLVRLIQKTQSGKLLEVELNNFEKLGKGWIATELVFKLDGKLKFIENYIDYGIPEYIDADNFNVEDLKIKS
jgi:hypothetical protein